MPHLVLRPALSTPGKWTTGSSVESSVSLVDCGLGAAHDLLTIGRHPAPALQPASLHARLESLHSAQRACHSLWSARHSSAACTVLGTQFVSNSKHPQLTQSGSVKGLLFNPRDQPRGQEALGMLCIVQHAFVKQTYWSMHKTLITFKTTLSQSLLNETFGSFLSLQPISLQAVRRL